MSVIVVHSPIYSRTCGIKLNVLCIFALSLQSCLTLCDPMDHSPPGSYIHGIFQAKILERVAISSQGFSLLRDQTCVSYLSCKCRWFFTSSATWGALHPALAGIFLTTELLGKSIATIIQHNFESLSRNHQRRKKKRSNINWKRSKIVTAEHMIYIKNPKTLPENY